MGRPVIMQLVLSLLAAISVYRVALRVRARQMGRALAGVWCSGVVVFLLFVWHPEFATRVSDFLGIGRGVDAALYIGVALLFYGVLRIIIRLDQQDDTLTKLVSEIALLHDATRNSDLGPRK